MSPRISSRSIALGANLHLATLSIASDEAPAVPPSVHRMFLCDVSGSMSGDLSAVREHLKNNLSLSVREGDTVSIGYFSGRGQFGMIVEGATVHGVTDLSDLHRAIDRWLRPIGLTGFKEPLEEIERVIERLSKRNPGHVFSLAFMSDGCDNQWKRSDILAVSERLGTRLASAAVVEYGWYADRPLLVAMAEAMGGEYVFAEGFSRFAPLLDAEFSREVSGARRREVALPAMPRHGVAFAVVDGHLTVWAVAPDQTIRVPGNVETVSFLADGPVGMSQGEASEVVGRARGGLADSAVSGLYEAVAVLSQRMKADDVLAILRDLGDVALIKGFANCFGKQAYSAFSEQALQASIDPALRWAEGYDPALVPRDDAYTVLDLLSDLMEGEGNVLHVRHPAFDYKRIGRKAEAADANFTDEEREEIAVMTAAARSASDFERVAARTAEIVASKPRPVEFKADENAGGVPMNTMTFNETRPNISVQTSTTGKVLVGKNEHGVPEAVPSRIFRNYAVIRDGILNVKALPVTLDEATHAKLVKAGVVTTQFHSGAVEVIDLGSLPLINRGMVSRVSALETFESALMLVRARAAQKVYRAFEDRFAPRERSAGLKAAYGEAAAEWLKSVGVTDMGFSPRTTLADAQDVYTAKEFKISIKGLSSLPKVEDVENKLAKGGKLSVSEALMAPFVTEVQGFLSGKALASAPNRDEAIRKFLSERSKHWTEISREINRTLARIKFSIVVGQVWFPEFDTPAEGSLDFKVDGVTYTGTAALKEIEEKV